MSEDSSSDYARAVRNELRRQGLDKAEPSPQVGDPTDETRAEVAAVAERIGLSKPSGGPLSEADRLAAVFAQVTRTRR